MTFTLNRVFAASSRVDPGDVRAVKLALNRLGYYAPPEKIGITDIPDRGIFTALKNFQKDSDLRATGEMRPGDATVVTLGVAEDAEAPKGKYIWHTVGDDKVRDSHASLEGAVRSWDESPAPGEEPNCRCWAEPLPDDPPIEPVYPDLYIIGGLLGPRSIKIAWKILRGILKSSGQSDRTSHGQQRSNQRGISQKDIKDAIKSAEKNGKVSEKTGKYGTVQKHYPGDNGVTVIIETEGRNAGKIITVWRN